MTDNSLYLWHITQDHLDPQVVIKLIIMLDEHNVFAKSFRMAKERCETTPTTYLRLKLISDRPIDGKIYNLPTISEVAALIVGDVDTPSNTDIILERQSGKLQRINKLHASYLGLQNPLLFVYGEDGYRHDVQHRDRGSQRTKRNRVTIREFFCFRLQIRKDEAQTLLRLRRRFEQFIVDGYTYMESERLSYIRSHQNQLKVDKYSTLYHSHEKNQTQPSNIGKRIILPFTFVGGRRFNDTFDSKFAVMVGFLIYFLHLHAIQIG